jgi:heme/copper-type cytochrome/quinol oxidase subunit 2
MGRFDRLMVKIAPLLVLLIVLVVPLGAWAYENKYIPAQYPPGAKVINLTGYGAHGMWTKQKVNGLNYWKGLGQVAEYASEIVVNEGDLVVFRLNSVDVQHSFAIPELGLDAGFVKVGQITELSFVADKPGTYTFICKEFCSPAHPAMFGVLTVKGK